MRRQPVGILNPGKSPDRRRPVRFQQSEPEFNRIVRDDGLGGKKAVFQTKGSGFAVSFPDSVTNTASRVFAPGAVSP